MPEYNLAPEPPPLGDPPTIAGSPPCSGCGYNLHGLPLNGACPECGHPVELSLRGRELRFASRDYIRSVDLGLTLILSSIVLYFICFVLSIAVAAIFGSTKGIAPSLIIGGMFLACSLLSIAGHWLFTQPDPGFTGIEKAASARAITRIAACVQGAAKLGSFFILLVGGSVVPGASIAAGLPNAASTLFRALDYLAWATLFFSMMLYIRWLAARIPDYDLITRTHTYIWLLPLLFTVGAIVFCLGPLAALILYATMLSNLRNRTKDIRDWQRRGGQVLV